MSTLRAGTKSAKAIAIMTKNADKPMNEVYPKIAKATGLNAAKAKHYYSLFVRKGLAPGLVPPRVKADAKVAKKSKAVNVAKIKAAVARKKNQVDLNLRETESASAPV